MRWSMQLRSPAWVADGRVLALADDDGRRARVTITADGDDVLFAVEAEGLPSAVRPAHPEWYNRAHLVVQLNPGHDHCTRVQYAVDDAGRVVASSHWVVPGEEPRDGPAVAPAEPSAARATFEATGEAGFRASLRVPASVLWPGDASLVGLAVKVGFHEEVVAEPLVWPRPVQWWEADGPMGFGDLVRTPPAVAVESVSVAEPAWGEPTELVLRVALGGGAPRTGRVHVKTVVPDDSEQQAPSAAWRASGDKAEVRTSVVFPHRGKWETRNGVAAALEIALTDDDGRRLWAGGFPFGFDFGIIVRERYGPRGRAMPHRPDPGDADFVEAFRRYVLARLPDYRAATTAEGAASDFYLVDPDGDADLDLAAADWPDALAAQLAERFGRWDDALAALAMWIYHPLITRHSASWARIAGSLTVDALPRIGGCFCGDTARLGAMLAERLGRRIGVPLRAWTLGLRGHLATLVETPVGRVVLDGMIGLWFHALDNTRLATLEEMRADRAVVDRMWYSPRRHGHEFYFGRDDQIVRDWQAGTVLLPDGTPR